MKKILILGQHMDDEVLSFGGLIAKEIKCGTEIKVHIFTCGGPCSNVGGDVRAEEFINVMEFLGVQHYSYSGIGYDGELDQIPSCKLTGMIDKMIIDFQPDEVYCGAISEHSDHQAVTKAFLGACRLKSGWMPKLLALGTYPFSDQLYTSPEGGKIFNPLTEDEYNTKLEAFKLYKSQFKPEPSPLGVRGLRTQAEYNGMLCGAKYAELYYQLRYIRA